MRDLLLPNAVIANLSSATKKDVLQDIARYAAGIIGQDEHTVFNVLWEREKLGTTGIGQGLAIPHGRLPDMQEVQGFFARLAEPVPFEAVDNAPVDMVFLLLAPESAGADHLHALATVSRLLRDQNLCARLRSAPDDRAIYRLLTETAAVAAA
ncbi:MAG: PTS IIA-like nitrogen regulatory protein PtsN [Pseudomonadota bacterium]|nr:PTS IIA-like nitrogen regulatory protein PtsN [Pseudomonadota bacterium]